MKLIVKIKNIHFVLFFLSICIFLPFSTLNSISLNKNNNYNYKDYVTSNSQTREFTNSNNGEINKKFIFVDNTKQVYLNKKNNIDQTGTDNVPEISSHSKEQKFLEDPLIIQKNLESRKIEEKNFDEKKIIELIQNVIKNNEKINQRNEKSKIIEELKILNLPMSLNSLLKGNSIRNSDKEISTELISHSNFLKNYQDIKETVSQANKPQNYDFPVHIENNHFHNSENLLAESINELNQINPNYGIRNQNKIFPNMNKNPFHKADQEYNEYRNHLAPQNIPNQNIEGGKFLNNYHVQYQPYSELSNDKINEVNITRLNNNLYLNQNPLNPRTVMDYNANFFINNKALLSNIPSSQPCPCQRLIKCKPCELNLENPFNDFPAQNQINNVNIHNCPCASKNICPPCARASLIHDLAYQKIKLINDKIGLKSYEMLRFAQQTEEIEKQALIIANKLNESNTRSFLAKKKMIQLNEKAREIALGVEYPNANKISCDPLRYPCDDITTYSSEIPNNFGKSSEYLTTNLLTNPDLNFNTLTNFNQIQNGFSNINSYFPPSNQANPLPTNSYYSNETPSNVFLADYSVLKSPSRHYTFDHEKSVSSEVIDRNERSNEDEYSNGDWNNKNKGKILLNFRKTNKSENYDRIINKRNLRKNLKANFTKNKNKINFSENDSILNDENVSEEEDDKKAENKGNQPIKNLKKNSSEKSDDKIKMEELEMIKEFEKNDIDKEKPQINVNKNKDKKLKDNEEKADSGELEIIREELRNFNKNLTDKSSNNKLKKNIKRSEKNIEIKDNTK